MFTAGSDSELTINLFFWTPSRTESVPPGDWRAQFKVHLTPSKLAVSGKSEEDAYFVYATLNGKLLSKRKMITNRFLARPVGICSI
jgi:hypothetical protein